MMNVINLLILTMIIVYVIDLSGFIQDGVEPMLAKLFHQRQVRLKKPWSCSRCMTLWIGLLYVLIFCHITIPIIGYVFLLSFLTPVFNNMLITIYEWLLKLTNNE